MVTGRPLLAYVPKRIGLGIIALIPIFAPYQYYLNGALDAAMVVLTVALLLWIVGYASYEYHKLQRPNEVLISD